MSDVINITREDGIAVLAFNRPASRNALTTELARAIRQGLVDIDADPDIKGIVLTGAGDKAFCAGVDLGEARGVEVHQIEDWFGEVVAIYRQILETGKPVICALNGVAAGGGFQIALVCDQRVAHAGVRMGQPEINAGIPSIMGTHWMRLHLGWSVVQDLSFTGRLMQADEAARHGLINHMVAPDQVVAKAREVALDFAAKPSVAWARTKAQFRDLALDGFQDAFRAGVLGQQEAFAQGQPQAIMDAFLAERAKRKG